jgi:hypothetical protein
MGRWQGTKQFTSHATWRALDAAREALAHAQALRTTAPSVTETLTRAVNVLEQAYRCAAADAAGKPLKRHDTVSGYTYSRKGE